MRIARWTTKATDTLSEYVVPMACPRPPTGTRKRHKHYAYTYMPDRLWFASWRCQRRSKAVVAKFQDESDPNVKDRSQTMKNIRTERFS